MQLKKAHLSQVVFQDASDRRAKDGESKLAMSERMDGVQRVVGGRVARAQPMAAAYEPVGGMIRVVIVREEPAWLPFFSTDPNTTVVEIIEAFADRATIEQDHLDLKVVWGVGEQQVQTFGPTWPSIISTCGCIRWWNFGPGTVPTRNFAIAAILYGTTRKDALRTPIVARRSGATFYKPNYRSLRQPGRCRQKYST